MRWLPRGSRLHLLLGAAGGIRDNFLTFDLQARAIPAELGAPELAGTTERVFWSELAAGFD